MFSPGVLIERVIDEVWYPAVVTESDAQGLFFKIVYIDDGNTEEGVSVDDIRDNMGYFPSTQSDCISLPGTLIERRIDQEWYPGMVLGQNQQNESDGGISHVDVVYLDDGNVEQCVPIEEVRFVQRENATSELAVEGSYVEEENIARSTSHLSALKISQLKRTLNQPSWPGTKPKVRKESVILPSERKHAVQQSGLRRSLSVSSLRVDDTVGTSFLPDLTPWAGLCAAWGCNKLTIFRCQRCNKTYYCSRKHQRKAWKDHSPHCWPALKAAEKSGWPPLKEAEAPWQNTGTANEGAPWPVQNVVSQPSSPQNKSIDPDAFTTPQKDRTKKAVAFADQDLYARGALPGEKRAITDSENTQVEDGDASSGECIKRLATAEGSFPRPAPIITTEGTEWLEDRITNLTDLGFSRELAMKALSYNQQNVERAAEWLFSQTGDVTDTYPDSFNVYSGPKTRDASYDNDGIKVYPAPDDLRGMNISGSKHLDSDMQTQIHETPTLEDDRDSLVYCKGGEGQGPVPPQRPSSPLNENDFHDMPELIPCDDYIHNGRLIYSVDKHFGHTMVTVQAFSQPIDDSWNADGFALRLLFLMHDTEEEHILNIGQADMLCIFRVHFNESFLAPDMEVRRAIEIINFVKECTPVYHMKRPSGQARAAGFELANPSGTRIICSSHPRKRGDAGRWSCEEGLNLNTVITVPDDGVVLYDGQWRCLTCTLVNEDDAVTFCTACQTPKPTLPVVSASIPSDSHDLTNNHPAQTAEGEEAIGGCSCQDFLLNRNCKHLPTIEQARAYGVEEEVLQKQI